MYIAIKVDMKKKDIQIHKVFLYLATLVLNGGIYFINYSSGYTYRKLHGCDKMRLYRYKYLYINYAIGPIINKPMTHIYLFYFYISTPFSFY